MLLMIGLGLADEGDLPRKALSALKTCEQVYCETYTNKWMGDLKKIEEVIGKPIQRIPRGQVESEFLITQANDHAIALLVAGDPLSATTHFELLSECRARNIPVQVIHASSIFTAVAETGLDLYKFGRTTTLVFPQKGFHPQSPFDVIQQNRSAGLHTLVLLDVQEEAQRYMTVADALTLLEASAIIGAKENIVACSRLGHPDQRIGYGSVQELKKFKGVNAVPAVLIIPGTLNHKEEEYLGWFHA